MAKTLIFVTATVFNAEGEAMSYTAFPEVGSERDDVETLIAELTEEARGQAFEDFESSYYGPIGCLVDVKKIELPDVVTIRTTTETRLEPSDLIVPGEKE